MAKCAKPLKHSWLWPGFLSSGFIFLILLLVVSGILYNVPLTHFINANFSPYIKRVIGFSFYQAFLSTLLSVIPGYFIAKALYRRHFRFKSLLLGLCSTTLILPSLVVVFGLIFLYGHSGIITQLFNSLLSEKFSFSLYGLKGILLAHVFFNLPYATLLFLKALNAISPHQLKLAAQLNFSQKNLFLLIEWPLIKKQAAYLFALIFTLCFSSFSIVLLLGGGPKATTIELAIYQAITYDYDYQKAAFLSLIQLVICFGLLLISQNLTTQFASASEASSWRLKSQNVWLRCLDIICIMFLVLLVIPPILAIVFAGLNSDFVNTLTHHSFLQALKNSLVIGLCSALLSVTLAISISWTARQCVLAKKEWLSKALISMCSIALMVPGIVLATGLYITFFQLSLTQTLIAHPYFIIPIINALMALPFVLNQLYPNMLNSAKAYQNICLLYGIKGINRLWLLDIKGNQYTLRKSFAFAMTMSLGDIGVISILGSQNSGEPFLTLPYLLLLKLGTYQSGSADVIALILLLLVLSIFMVASYKPLLGKYTVLGLKTEAHSDIN